MNISPLALACILAVATFGGALMGVVFSLKSFTKNELFPVLPGQLWLLPGVGIIRVAHVGTPGKEIVYLYENTVELAPGTCSKKELVKHGMLLEAMQGDTIEEEDELPENVVRFPKDPFDFDEF
tara:strand:- start:692 stop:1063 length:372 start_codon:yes stop_codon:yes gene_type:complete